MPDTIDVFAFGEKVFPLPSCYSHVLKSRWAASSPDWLMSNLFVWLVPDLTINTMMRPQSNLHSSVTGLIRQTWIQDPTSKPSLSIFIYVWDHWTKFTSIQYLFHSFFLVWRAKVFYSPCVTLFLFQATEHRLTICLETYLRWCKIKFHLFWWRSVSIIAKIR